MTLLILLLIISVKVLLITCHTFSILDVFVQEFGHQPPEWLKEIASSSGIGSKIKLTHSLTQSHHVW